MGSPDATSLSLTTKRLTLSPIQASDESELLNLWRDPEVRRYLWDNQIISQDQVSAIQSASERCFSEHGIGLYSIALQEQPGNLAGFCGLREFEEPGQLELLYGIYPQYWGQGIVSEAATAVLSHGFQQCGLQQVIAATDTPNQPSVRVMQRLGMAFAQRRQWHGLDTVFYSLNRDEFLTS